MFDVLGGGGVQNMLPRLGGYLCDGEHINWTRAEMFIQVRSRVRIRTRHLATVTCSSTDVVPVRCVCCAAAAARGTPVACLQTVGQYEDAIFQKRMRELRRQRDKLQRQKQQRDHVSARPAHLPGPLVCPAPTDPAPHSTLFLVTCGRDLLCFCSQDKRRRAAGHSTRVDEAAPSAAYFERANATGEIRAVRSMGKGSLDFK